LPLPSSFIMPPSLPLVEPSTLLPCRSATTITSASTSSSSTSSLFSSFQFEDYHADDDHDDDDDATSSLTTTMTATSSIPPSKSLRHCLEVDDDYYSSSSSSSRDYNLKSYYYPTTTTTKEEEADENKHYKEQQVPWIVGHRGCLYQELENTREGFQQCARMGCDAFELDVFLLKCGTLVVFHGGGTDELPGLLEEYCIGIGINKNSNNNKEEVLDGGGGRGRASSGSSILDYTYQEAVEQLTFNPNHAEFPCPVDVIRRGRIPTLEEVLVDAKQSGIHVKIELKGGGTAIPTIELVERLGMLDQCSYSSFDLGRLQDLRAFRPNRVLYPSGALFDQVPSDYLERAQECGATEVHLKYDTCTRSRVQAIHAAGLGSMLWMRGPVGMASDCADKYWDVGNSDPCEEDEAMYLVLIDTGVEQMCVNKPDILIRMRSERQNQQESEDEDLELLDGRPISRQQRNETEVWVGAA
jgi:glycerophosphoryl diester phosphodiesterase